MNYLRFLVVFVPLLAVMGATDENMLSRIGLDAHRVVALPFAALVALLIHQYRPVYLVLALVVAVLANSPAAMVEELTHLDRDYIIALFISSLITPFIMDELG